MPDTASTSTRPLTGSSAVVVGFLDALAADQVEIAMGMLTPDALWINVSLPTVRGRRAIERLCRLLVDRWGAGFAVVHHHVVADGDLVITDRRDELSLGRFRASFWVYGRFTLTDGKISVWRDSFDNLDVAKGILRGLVGIVVPAASRRLTAS